MQYTQESFDKFLFALGDFSLWLISTNHAVTNGFKAYTDADRDVIKSSLNPRLNSNFTIKRSYDPDVATSPTITLIRDSTESANTIFQQGSSNVDITNLAAGGAQVWINRGKGSACTDTLTMKLPDFSGDTSIC